MCLPLAQNQTQSMNTTYGILFTVLKTSLMNLNVLLIYRTEMQMSVAKYYTQHSKIQDCYHEHE